MVPNKYFVGGHIVMTTKKSTCVNGMVTKVTKGTTKKGGK